MDAVTYPDARVQQLINDKFSAIKLNLREPRPETRDLLRRVKPQWAPLFLFLDPRGTELRRYIGWLAPDEFLAELTFVLGMQDLVRARIESALQNFRAAADQYPDASVAAEAMFFAGAAAYKLGGLDALRPAWDELVRRYPESTWARRANVWDMVTPPA